MGEVDGGGVSFRLLVIRTGQMDKVRTFYQSLGIDLTEERHGKGPLHYAGHAGDAVFEVYPLTGGGTADTTIRLGFAVHALEKVLGSLQAAGVEVVHPPQQTAWGYRAVVRDPDGRAVELHQEEGPR